MVAGAGLASTGSSRPIATPDLPIEVSVNSGTGTDSVSRHVLEIRRAFWSVGVTARAQKLSRIEAMQSVEMYSSRTHSVRLQGCHGR